MSDFLKMDIFFAVTTAAVFFAGLMILVALYYMIGILRSVDHVAKNVAKESDSVRGDVAVLRAKIREEGMRVGHLVDFFLGMRERKAARHERKKNREKGEAS